MPGGGSNSQVVGYKFKMGIHMGICRGPVDEVVEIKAGDRYIWRGSQTTNGTVNIDAAEVFGGEDGEGGIAGPLTFLFGGPSQTAPAEMQTVLSTPMPGFRRMLTCFFDGIIGMINPYPKPWKFRVRRVTQGWDGECWYPERARITLVRQTSEAEQQEVLGGAGNTRTSTENLGAQVDLTPYLTVIEVGTGIDATIAYIQPNPITITLAIPDGATLISVDYLQVSNGGAGIDNMVENLPGSAWSVSGNVITIQGRPTDFGDPYIRPWGTSIFIGYTASVVSIVPGSPGTSGGGPSALGVATIHAMNPAHILYETLTNREWGRGLPRETLDDTNWRSAADRLYSEGFGLCLRWNRTDEIQSFIRMILDHINATLYEDRSTGKIKIQLMRGDYDRAQVPLFTSETGLLEINDSPVAAQGPLINEVKLTYLDPVTDTERTVRASNLANLQASGGEINSKSVKYLGIPVAELAAQVCKRDLKASSTKLRKFTVTLDRRGSSLVPGGVLRIEDPVRNIGDIVLRIGAVDYGHLRDGKVKIQAVQDVFALPSRAFSPMPPPIHLPPTSRPCVGPAAAFEMPYWALRRTLTAAEFDQLDDSDAFLAVVVGEGQPMNVSYDIATKFGAPTIDEQPADSDFYCGYTP